MDITHDLIVVEQHFDLPAKRLWEAITNHSEMIKWFFENIPTFSAEPGFYTEFNIHHEGRDFLHQWKILEVIPEQRIVYDWRYEQYDGVGRVEFELIKVINGTNLRVSNYGLHTFPKDVPEFSIESCRAGWNYFIKDRLVAYLNQKV
ncbi:MAG: SRPBCC domain-containing protein [Bacteroidia bacterium]|nr:SRPBCC domain-containing protein [Bacteroidia bacterium]MBT8267604.1 SRPBCC domain-containing protein [Bacteroidia bacterium]NNK70466.1 SRPBCC domain-containing protein [Flavobacteriaceae bacterium]NNL79751.1 SRPBCC domain-containing protein [Flavobacteriaceae bacterium]